MAGNAMSPIPPFLPPNPIYLSEQLWRKPRSIAGLRLLSSLHSHGDGGASVRFAVFPFREEFLPAPAQLVGRFPFVFHGRGRLANGWLAKSRHPQSLYLSSLGTKICVKHCVKTRRMKNQLFSPSASSLFLGARTRRGFRPFSLHRAAVAQIGKRIVYGNRENASKSTPCRPTAPTSTAITKHQSIIKSRKGGQNSAINYARLSSSRVPPPESPRGAV